MSKYAPHKVTVNNPRASSSTLCQRCLQRGHFTYQCKNSRPYVSRPTRTQLLDKPNALANLKAEGKPSEDVPEEFLRKAGTANEILAAKEQARQTETESKKRKRSRSTSSEGSSESSESSESNSDSSHSTESSESGSSDSRSRASSLSPSHTRKQERRRPRSRRRSRSLSTEDELDDGRGSRR